MRWLPAVLLTGLLGACSAAPGARTQALSGGQTLWLDLTGASIASAPTDDATTNRSTLGAATVPAFDASMVAPDVSASDAATVLVSRVQSLFLPYDLQVVTSAPTSGDYFAVYVGGTSAILTSQPSGIAGVGDVDCDDANPDSTGFVFSASFTPATGGLVSLAATIAHEAGHGLGLEHSSNPHDPMYSVAAPQQAIGDLFTLAFGSGDYSSFTLGAGMAVAEKCGHADPIDNVALLDAALGANPSSLGAPPAVEIAFPPPNPTLPTTVPLELDVTGAVRVEIYRDLALVAVLPAGQAQTTLTLPESSATTLTVEVVGPDGQRARASRTFAVSANVAALCDESTPCPSGEACVDSSCKPVFDGGGGDASASDAGTTSSKSHGCDYGERSSPLALLVTGCWAAATCRRRRRASPSA